MGYLFVEPKSERILCGVADQREVHPLYLVLGIFIPLITTNCIVLARADAFAAKNHPLHSVVDAIAMGLGLTLVLVVLGAIRELAGQGTLFSGIDLVFGANAKQFVLRVLPGYKGFLLAILPPGAFLALGLLIAANNWRKARDERRARSEERRVGKECRSRWSP